MARPPVRSFAARLMLAYVGAAIGLIFLIEFASTFFTLQLYGRTTNDVIARVTQTLERRIANVTAQHVPLTRLAPLLTADLGPARIRVAVYNADGRLLSESAPPR